MSWAKVLMSVYNCMVHLEQRKLSFVKFFDCFNVKDTHQQCTKKIKPFLEIWKWRWCTFWLAGLLYRISWWVETKYFKETEFTQTQRNYVYFLTDKISIKSLQEIIPYLLRNGFDYVFKSENFCQDDLENYFGRQRAIGSRKTNPNSRDTIRHDWIIKKSIRS